MAELIYTFASLAARTHDHETCINGMRLLAETLHPHGVPITWLVSPASARLAKEALTEWHELFGDAVALCTPDLSQGIEHRFQGSRAEKEAAITHLRDELQRALPWAELRVAAGNHHDPEVIQILESLGFEGLWGFCWEQIEVDAITDRGCPWGFYYIDPAQRLRPAQGRGLVAMEWTARDLLKAFHSGNPCLYSTDPNDAARGGLCAWEDITYWKGLAENYRRNTRYNEQVILLQHQEAHEMERHPGWNCYTEEDIREAAGFLDAFVRHLKPSARFLTLNQAAAAYRAQNARTASSYMLWEDTPHRTPNPDYSWNTCPGPWPKTFLYYDCDCQMIFVEGQVQPVCIRNYAKPWDTAAYFAEPEIPRPRLVHDTRFNWRREMEMVVESPKAIPYGVALWGDYSLYQIGAAPGLIEGKILPRELLFLRYQLQPGENRLRICLEGK